MNIRRAFWRFVHDRAEWLWHYAWRQYCKHTPEKPTSPRIWHCNTDRKTVHVEQKWHHVGDKQKS